MADTRSPFEALRDGLDFPPKSSDGPDYHAELAFWQSRMRGHLDTLESELEACAQHRDALSRQLDRIRAAAESDADLAGLAVRDFLLRETEGTVPYVLGRIPEAVCEICGESGDLRYRGWTDEGSPMETCENCGGPTHEQP